MAETFCDESAELPWDDWDEQVEQLPGLAAQVRATIDDAAETVRFNPRRWLMRAPQQYGVYRRVVEHVRRLTDQLRLVTRDMRQLADGADDGTVDADVRRDAAEVMASVAEVIEVLGDFDGDVERSAQRVETQVRRGERACGRLAPVAEQDLRTSAAWSSSVALHTDLRRLVEDCGVAHAELVRRCERTPESGR